MCANERFQDSVNTLDKLSSELTQFKNELAAAFDNEDSAKPCVIENSDHIHNSLIMSSLFEKANEINMYCGEMSVLRKGFYEHVRADNETADSDYCINHFDKTLKEFLAKTDSALNIYVENWKDSLLDDLYPVDEEFKDALASKKIRIFKEKGFPIGLPKNMAHITLADGKWIRVEIDRKDHKGVFIVPPPESSISSSTNFFKNLAILTELIDACK